MTREEFLTELSKTPRTWTVERDGAIRCAKGDCPITAVYRLHDQRHTYSPSDFHLAARKLELEGSVHTDVVCASDGLMSKPKDQILRTALLHACGLEK